MKVVLDANVLISAVIEAGPSYRIVVEWESQTPPAITPAAFAGLLEGPDD